MLRASYNAKAACIEGTFSSTLLPSSDLDNAKRRFIACAAACRKLGFAESSDLPSLVADMPISIDQDGTTHAVCGIAKRR